MMNNIFKLPVLTGLAVFGSGLVAKTAVATENMAVREVAPLVQQGVRTLAQDTFTFVPKTAEATSSVLLPEAGLLAHLNGYQHNHQPQQPSEHFPQTVGCLFTRNFSTYDNYGNYQVISKRFIMNTTVHNDHQKHHAINRCNRLPNSTVYNSSGH